MASSSVLNFNVGVLGHVDSGKTSLAKAISTVSSTAAFDKNPQSQERGITLDLGFSSFIVPAPDHIKHAGYTEVQYTLVDCPGHASLIRTIIGGAQIIDLMMLVVDVTKGIQTQTAECLVIGEITCDTMLVVINKVDLLPKEKREQAVEKMKKKLRMALSKTKFSNCEMVAVAAKPDEENVGDGPIGISNLVAELSRLTISPTERDLSAPFLFAVDHCFSIRGQGTIMTGTVLQGTVNINDSIEIASMKEVRKVKSVQMFKRPVQRASQGDRIGMCVTQFDAKLLERGIACAPGYVTTIHGCVIDMVKIPYFKGEIATKSKFHISLGHETVLGRLTLFYSDGDTGDGDFSLEREYHYLEKISDLESTEEGDSKEEQSRRKVFAIVEFDRPVPVVPKCKVLGSRLDTDTHTTSCRLAFHGQLRHPLSAKDYSTTELPQFKIFKVKSKEGVVERIGSSSYEVICKGMFKKETDLANLFAGLRVSLSSGEGGKIEDSFGQSGKFKVSIDGEGLKESTKAALEGKKKRSKDKTAATSDTVKEKPISIHLEFKRYIFSKKMAQ